MRQRASPTKQRHCLFASVLTTVRTRRNRNRCPEGLCSSASPPSIAAGPKRPPPKRAIAAVFRVGTRSDRAPNRSPSARIVHLASPARFPLCSYLPSLRWNAPTSGHARPGELAASSAKADVSSSAGDFVNRGASTSMGHEIHLAFKVHERRAWEVRATGGRPCGASGPSRLGGSRPGRESASTAASVRLGTCSLARIQEMWCLTVCRLIDRACAISMFPPPSASSPSTSSSRQLRSASVSVARGWSGGNAAHRGLRRWRRATARESGRRRQMHGYGHHTAREQQLSMVMPNRGGSMGPTRLPGRPRRRGSGLPVALSGVRLSTSPALSRHRHTLAEAG